MRFCCRVPEPRHRFGARRDRPHNFRFLIDGLFDELKYAVRTKKYINKITKREKMINEQNDI